MPNFHRSILTIKSFDPAVILLHFSMIFHNTVLSNCFRLLFSLSMALTACKSVIAQPVPPALEAQFRSPSADTRPGCYWYWINDNISKEGITKDLEAMARVGIGRAYIGHIFDRRKPTDTAPGKIKFMSREWWDALQWAVKEAGRCGIDIGFFNSPGWSQSGGPWITPSQSMRYLGNSELAVTGGVRIDTILPVPEIRTFPNSGGAAPHRTGPNFTAREFQDVRVIAFKQPDTETTDLTRNDYSFTGNIEQIKNLFDTSDSTYSILGINKEFIIDFKISKNYLTKGGIQTILIKPADYSFTMVCRIEKSDDGHNFLPVTTYTEERGQQGAKNTDIIAIPFPKLKEEFIRLRIVLKGNPRGKDKIRIAEVRPSSRALLASYVRKQLGETSPKAKLPWNAYIWDDQPSMQLADAVSSAGVVDLTGKMDAAGRLAWNAPPGKWVILRMGMIPTGTQCHPCSAESLGLEVDKMNKDHLNTLFEGMVGEFIRRTPEKDRKALKYLIADSYETGPQNWTDDFLNRFSKRFGYSPVRFLPVLTGRVVDSPEVSNRFLWDLRKLITESVAYEYVGGLRDIAHKYGLTLWLENYGHWGFLSEFLLYGSQTDQVGGEFWESANATSNIECRAAASSAHTYGKNEVYAEAFTSNRSYSQSPASLKSSCDWMYGTGINHLIFHVYIHQPDERKPGITEWFGTAFNRHNTWFEESKPFIDYIRRSAVLLKSGTPVADVAYYIGEDPPSMDSETDPQLPDGYDFDHVNPDVLINRMKVKDGRLVIDNGPSYAVMVLPKRSRMRPEVAEALRKLVREGAIIIGPKPIKSPSLQAYPACDKQLNTITNELWANVNGTTVKKRRYGKGWVYDNIPLTEVLSAHSISPDVKLLNSNLLCAVAGNGKMGTGQTGGLLFKHRSVHGNDIYFLSNTSDTDTSMLVSFRQKNRVPCSWNAVTGKIAEIKSYLRDSDRTNIRIHLEPSESIYITFGESAAGPDQHISVLSEPAYTQTDTLNKNWTVRFNGQGAPALIKFDKLTDWIKHPNESIQNYSGTAVYENTFKISSPKNGRTILNLGKVNVIATVWVNDKLAGTLWTTPWETDITDFVRKGENNLKIYVTSTWNNRLLADDSLAPGRRYSYVSQPYLKQPPASSGLLGPVVLKQE